MSNAGRDCTCYAHGECECGCGADWRSDREVLLEKVVSDIKEVLMSADAFGDDIVSILKELDNG